MQVGTVMEGNHVSMGYKRHEQLKRARKLLATGTDGQARASLPSPLSHALSLPLSPDIAPYTLPNTLHPAPYTLHPTPYILHPTLYTLHPKPAISLTPSLCLSISLSPFHGQKRASLNPKPCTLNPQPSTLHPTP